MPSDSLTLDDLRERVLTGLAEDAEGDGEDCAFLPYALLTGFQPSAVWGDGKDEANPVASGRFYAAAFTDGNTVIRVAMNPADAPSSLAPTLPPKGLDWKKTGAGALLHEASEAAADGTDAATDYFRVPLGDDVMVVYEPQDKRKQLWETVEELASAVATVAAVALITVACGAQQKAIPGALDTQAIDVTAETGPAELPPCSSGAPDGSILEMQQSIAIELVDVRAVPSPL